ncbi:MAG: alpha/beta fold hydrolase [Gammaproteobacteria bacterium]
MTTSLEFQTTDGLKIQANLYSKNAHTTLILVAPGFSQFKDSRPLQRLGADLQALADVLIMDFRGTGQSEGRYTFGAREYLDLQPALTWARGHYQKVIVLGFSLGAYTTLRAAELYPQCIDHLLLIACPTQFEDVVKSGLFLSHFLWRKKPVFKIAPEVQPFFRWGWPFYSKPNAKSFVNQIHLPADFLKTEDDTLVQPSQTQQVFEAYAGPKTLTVMPGRYHAEGLYLFDPEVFVGWVKQKLC